MEQQKPKKIKSNLTSRERKALNRLAENDKIVIKNTDKGGAIVLQDSKDYENEVLRQLSDKQFYKQTNKDLTVENTKKIIKTLKDLEKSGEIGKKMADKLSPKDPRTPVFYTSPKIHKEGNPGRPVVSSSGSHTEKISAYVDNAIKPIAMNLLSYTKDSNDFIHHINKKRKVPKGSFLVTMDVSSFYTN